MLMQPSIVERGDPAEQNAGIPQDKLSQPSGTGRRGRKSRGIPLPSIARNLAPILQVVLSVGPVTFGPSRSALQFVSFVDRLEEVCFGDRP